MTRFLLLLPIMLLLGACGSARFNTDRGNHATIVADSRSENMVVVSMDTIYKAGTPYGLFRSIEVNMLQSDHAVYALNGDELINITQSSPKSGNRTYQEYKFLDRDANGSAFVEFAMSAMTIVDRVVDNDLLNPAGLNRNNAVRFMLKYPDPDNRPKAPEANRMVDRNRSRPVRDDFTERKIYQGDVLIGTYNTSRGAVNGTDITTATIYYRDGTVAAVARYKTFGSNNTEVTTTKDNKAHTIDGAYVNRSNMEQAVQYLVDNLYL